MEFSIKKSVEAMRVGTLCVTEVGRTFSLPMPGCVLYTKSGCVPHLTHDLLPLSLFQENDDAILSCNGQTNDPLKKLAIPMLFPLGQFIPHRKNLAVASESESEDSKSKSKDSESTSESSSDESESTSARSEPRRGLLEFAGLSRDFDILSFCVQNDPAAPLPSGFNAGQSVALWNFAGKAEVTPSLAAEVTSAMSPHVAQILADSDVGFHRKEVEGTSKKRVLKALKRSRNFVDHVERQIEEVEKEEVEKEEKKETKVTETKAKTTFWATTIAGLERKDLKSFLDELPKTVKTAGFVLDGFLPPKDLSVVESPTHAKRVVDCVSEINAILPPSSPRFLPHVATPRLVVEAVEKGVDLFDTSYAFVASGRGGAFVFECDVDAAERNGEATTSSSSSSSPPSELIEIDLNKTDFSEDFSPLLKDCVCYSCKTHTRAYVHHLLVTQELLAHVLLMIHNQFRYTKFFSHLRGAIAAGKWTQFKDLILSHRHEIPEKTKNKSDVEGDGSKKRKKLVL